MALEDTEFFKIPMTSLGLLTVSGTSRGTILTDDKGGTLSLGREAEKYVSTLKEGDQIIVGQHGGVLFVYGPVDESKFYSAKRVY